MSVAPAPGDVYNNPPIPTDFAGMGVTPGIIGTCLAVTSGPDRNIYWVYDDMKSSDTAIQTPVSRGVCFETRDSIALSQRKTVPTDTCSTCRHTLARHMTAAQATTAFSTHAAGFPAAHARITTVPALGVIHPPGTAAVLCIIAPIPAAGVAAAARLAVTSNTPSLQANREDYKLLVSMASHRDKWSTTKSIAHEFISKLETALRQSPISAVHWIYFLPLMVSEHDRNMQDWIEANITTPNLSWNAARAVFIKHYEHEDHRDTLLIKYKACVQGPHELVQKYTDRFSALMRQLNFGDADFLNIAHYMNGLRTPIYTKLIEHRSDMRNLPLPNGAAAWDFVSFEYVSSKASSFENELSARDRDQARDKRPALAHDHARAVPTQHKRKQEHKRSPTSPRKRVRVPSDLHCKWHPESQSHSTKDCRNPGTTVARTTSTTTTRAAATTVGKDLSKVECYGCGKMGHYKPDCPHKDQWSKNNDKKIHVAKNKNPKARAASVSFGPTVPADK